MTNSKFKHVKISGINAIIPSKCINIDDEIEFYKNDAKLLERNKKILGLGKRYVVDNGTTTADLCEAAANNLIDEMNIDKATIDSLIVVSTSHDYAYPATSCVLHGRLGLSEKCMCFDIAGLACSGYVHGLLQAHALIESGAFRRCLLLVGDISSTHSDVRNRNVNMLFGDAGTATLLDFSEEETMSYFHTGTRGIDWKKIIAPASGYALPVRKDIANIEVSDDSGNIWHLWEDIMRGFDVFKFTMEIAPASIEQLLLYSGKTKDDIDFFAFHQANGQIVNNIAKYSKIPKEKYSAETFRKYANTSTASVITVLADCLKGKEVKDIMLITFGVGLSWGSAILDFSKTYNGGIKKYKSSQNKPSRDELINYWIKYNNGEVE